MFLAFAVVFFPLVHPDDLGLASKEFRVLPGGRLYSESVSRYSVGCMFTYKCQGGTDELWRISLFKIRDDHNFGCRIERIGEGRSYLIFQQFRLEVTPSNGLLTGSAWGNNNQPLLSEDFVVNKATGIVSSQGGKFGYELNGLSAEFTSLVASAEL